MISTIRWLANARLHFLGRNGIAKCTGLDVFHHEGVVELQPYTSKGRVGRCRLCIPVAALRETIGILSAVHKSAQNSNLVSGAPGAGVSSTLAVMLEDREKPERRRVMTRIEAASTGVEIFSHGYGTACAARGRGSLVFLEIHDERLRLAVWADITSEDPTHVIDLEGARENRR